jgi:serine protease Do
MDQQQQQKKQVSKGPDLGISVENLTGKIRQQTGYEEEGVIVSQVRRYGPAFEAGIRRGDLITAIEGNEITSVSQYNDAINKLEEGDVAIFNVMRGDNSFHAFVEYPEEE